MYTETTTFGNTKNIWHSTRKQCIWKPKAAYDKLEEMLLTGDDQRRPATYNACRQFWTTPLKTKTNDLNVLTADADKIGSSAATVKRRNTLEHSCDNLAFTHTNSPTRTNETLL